MFLLDTNVVSELRKISLGRADANVTGWSKRHDPDDLYISVITVHELEVGVLRLTRRDKVQGDRLRKWLDISLMPAFAGRIVPVDTVVALRAARFQIPNPHPIQDGLIAATALVHGMTVVTRNVGDYAGTGVAVLNPWVG
jgi:predicted nucleic acid-binding protein